MLPAGTWIWWLKFEHLVLRAEDGRATTWKQSGQCFIYSRADYFLEKGLWQRGKGAEIQSRLWFPSCVPGERLAFYFPQKDRVLLSPVPTRLLSPRGVPFSNLFKGATWALFLWSTLPSPVTSFIKFSHTISIFSLPCVTPGPGIGQLGQPSSPEPIEILPAIQS